jgi:hypothetical protein
MRLENYSDTIFELTKKAQEIVLPPERRRHVNTSALLGQEVHELIGAAIKALQEKATAPVSEPAPVKVAAAPFLEPDHATNGTTESAPPIVVGEPDNVPRFITVEVENKDPARVIRAMSIGDLIGKAIDRIYEDFKKQGFGTGALMTALTASLSKTGMTYTPPPPVAPVEPPREKKAKVLVIGLLGNQTQDVTEKVRHLPVEVRYLGADAVGRDIPPSAEFIILEKHISHKWYGKAQASMPSDRMFFVHGTTGVVQKLHDVASRQGSGW